MTDPSGEQQTPSETSTAATSADNTTREDLQNQVKGVADPGGGESLEEAAAHAIHDVLVRETERKSSLEQRGITVVTTSTALATLVFSVVTLVTKSNTSTSLIGSEKGFVIAGLFCFVVAGALGILVNYPRPGVDVTPDDALRLLTLSDSRQAYRSVAEKDVEIIRWRREGNKKKAEYLLCASAFEVLAVIAIGIALSIFVFRVDASVPRSAPGTSTRSMTTVGRP
jgi:hypothetical protein